MTFPLMVLIKTFDWSSFCSQMPNTVLNRLSVSADVLTLFSLYGAVFGSKCLLLLLLLCKYGPCCIWSLLSESIFVHQTILNHKICAVDARIVRTCLSRPAGLSPAGPLHLLAASLPTILCVPADLPGIRPTCSGHVVGTHTCSHNCIVGTLPFVPIEMESRDSAVRLFVLLGDDLCYGDIAAQFGLHIRIISC